MCRAFTYIWLIAAVVLSCSAVASCEFVTRNELTIGLFRYSRNGEECIEFSDLDDFDYGWLHDWARVSGLLAPLLGVMVIVLMAVDCCCDVCCSKYMETFLVVCCQINQGFTFLIWVSNACFTNKGSDAVINKGCRIGEGSSLSFSAFMMYLIGGFFLFCSPKPDPSCCKKDDDDKKGKSENNTKSNNAKEDENNKTAQEDKPKDEEDPVVVAAVVKKEDKEEEKEEDPKEEEAKQTNAVEKSTGEDELNEEGKPEEKAIPDEEAQADPEEEEAQEEENEAPAVVPVVVPVASPKSETPPPNEESGMEVSFDEEFGTSQVRAQFD